jgi:hypothetical protein
MAKGKGRGGMILIVTTIIGVALLSFGLIQLNFDLSFIGFDITGNVTAGAIPEINESVQQLLNAKEFVASANVIEVTRNFALGERFQLTSPTVISDFTIRLATEDPNVTVTGYIWNIDISPPLRLVSSVETFNGTDLGTVLDDKTFTFARAVVLEPTANVTCVTAPCDPVPVNYIVGIRVDQNLAGSFTYGFNETESSTVPASSDMGVVTPEVLKPETHEAQIDILVGTDGETQFAETTPRGLLGIDIFHDAGFAVVVMEEIDDIIDMSMNGTATDEEELTACIAIFPPPPECVNTDPLAPQTCGVAEEFNTASQTCVCKDGFSQQSVTLSTDSGSQVIECLPDPEAIETSAIPPPLQVPPRVDPIVFIGLGGAIIAISIIGIGVRAIRK